jgi:hypothetical protein
MASGLDPCRLAVSTGLATFEAAASSAATVADSSGSPRLFAHDASRTCRRAALTGSAIAVRVGSSVSTVGVPWLIAISGATATGCHDDRSEGEIISFDTGGTTATTPS